MHRPEYQEHMIYLSTRAPNSTDINAVFPFPALVSAEESLDLVFYNMNKGRSHRYGIFTDQADKLR